ncbi:MAG: serine hydrolase domain-containing protein [Pseudomonadales bacterium]
MSTLHRSIVGAMTIVLLGMAASNPSAADGRAGLDPVTQNMLATLGARLAQGPQTEGLLFFSSAERRVAFGHIDLLYPTRTVVAGPEPYPLAERPEDFSNLTYEVDGERHALADFLARPEAIGLIVVKDGDILLEHYAPDNDRASRWISFSVTKSVTSMLIGAAIADGFIDSVDEPVAHYLPRLRGTPYEASRIRDVLNMASGVAWNEDYADPQSDVARAGGANGVQLVRYLAALPRQHQPGEVFNYNTGETNLVGEILRAAIGNNAATYLSHKVWQPFGMESDATWLTSAPGAGEAGGCCISATLRDYARLGIFAMNDGVLPDGRRVLPEGWMQASVEPSSGSAGYGYLWWLPGDEAFAARGIFSQQIFIDPAQALVIAAHGNAPTATGSEYARHLAAVTDALRGVIRAR